MVQRLIADNSANYGVEVVTAGLECKVENSYTTGLNASGLAEIKEVIAVSTVSVFSPLRGKLLAGDVVKNVTVKRGGTVIENMNVERMHNITDALISVKTGDSVTFTVERDGRPLEVTVSFLSSSFEVKDDKTN